VEEGAGSDHLRLLHEFEAALADCLVEVFDGLEVTVYERLVDDEGPQMLGRLQLLWAGWKTSRMPSGTARFCGPCQPALSSWSTMRLFGPAPTDLALDKARHVEPLEAMMPECNGTFADRCPHAARNRLQADAMLVRRPDLDLGARMLAPLISGGALQFFFRRERSGSLAVCGWRGRGCWIDQPIAMSASQPRWSCTDLSP
jgi:hypothetical protein